VIFSDLQMNLLDFIEKAQFAGDFFRFAGESVCLQANLSDLQVNL
jgi:hypothetical protein